MFGPLRQEGGPIQGIYRGGSRSSNTLTLYTYTREVLDSNLCQGTGYPENFIGFPQSLSAITWRVSRLSHERFLPNPCTLPQSTLHSSGTRRHKTPHTKILHTQYRTVFELVTQLSKQFTAATYTLRPLIVCLFSCPSVD